MKKISKIKKHLKNNAKIVIAFTVGLLLSGGVVYATTSGYLYDADEVQFDPTDTNLSSTDVQGALEELNGKAKKLKVGDYFTYTPDRTENYLLYASYTWYSDTQTLAANAVSKWRVIGNSFISSYSELTPGYYAVSEEIPYMGIKLEGYGAYNRSFFYINGALEALYSVDGLATGFLPGSLVDTQLLPGYSGSNFYQCTQKTYPFIASDGTFERRLYSSTTVSAICESSHSAPLIHMIQTIPTWENVNLYSSTVWLTGDVQYYGSSNIYGGFSTCLGLNCSYITAQSAALIYYSTATSTLSEITSTINIRPFVKIHPDAKIASGSGTSSDPYVLVAPSS